MISGPSAQDFKRQDVPSKDVDNASSSNKNPNQASSNEAQRITKQHEDTADGGYAARNSSSEAKPSRRYRRRGGQSPRQKQQKERLSKAVMRVVEKDVDGIVGATARSANVISPEEIPDEAVDETAKKIKEEGTLSQVGIHSVEPGEETEIDGETFVLLPGKKSALVR